MTKTKRKVVAWLLSLCMVTTLFAGVPANAAWDDPNGEYEEGPGFPYMYGLLAAHWVETYNAKDDCEELVLNEDGRPATWERRENEDGDEEWELVDIDYTDYTETSFTGNRLWLDYKENVSATPKHVNADDGKLKVEYTAVDPSDANNSDYRDVTNKGMLTDDSEYEGVVDFVPTEGEGWYVLSYGARKSGYPEESLIICVTYPDIGFYSAKEKSRDKLLLDELNSYGARNTLFKGEGVNRDIYLYLNSRDDREIKLATGGAINAWDEPCPAFELIPYDGPVLTGNEDGIKCSLEDGEKEYLKVQDLGEGWYKLTFADEMVVPKDPDNEESEEWVTNGFDLRVNAVRVDKNYDEDTETWRPGWYDENSEWKDNDPFYIDAWLHCDYKSLGLYAQIEGEGDIYTESDEIGFGMNPNCLTLSFGKSVAKGGIVTSTSFTPELDKINVEADIDGFEGETKDTYDCKMNGKFVDFVFYNQGRYTITYEGIDGCVNVHTFLDGIAFYSTPKRAKDNEKVDNLLLDKKVDEGKTDTVYVLAWVDPYQAWSTDVSTMEITAEVNGKAVPSYIEKGKEIKAEIYDYVNDADVERVIGYEVKITAQAKEDFTIVAAANKTGKGIVWDEEGPARDEEGNIVWEEDEEIKREKDTAELPVIINNVKELKIATPPTKTTYNEGEKFDAKGMVVKAIYEDTEEEVITNYTVAPAGALKATDKAVTITYLGKTATQSITVKAKAAAVPQKGTKLTDTASKATYTVSSSDSKNPTVEYTGTTDKNAKTINIPATVTINGVTYKVTSIANNAFKGNKKVTKITVGSNVTTIGKNAFNGCKKLKTVTIGKNVTSIGAGAFKGCAALTKLTLPAKTTKIGKDAFNGCKKLKTLTIKSKKLTSKTVKKGAFKGLTKKTTIKVPKNKVSAYKKLLKSKGLSSKVKVKK